MVGRLVGAQTPRILTHFLVIQDFLVPNAHPKEIIAPHECVLIILLTFNQKTWAHPTELLKLGHISDSSSDVSEAWGGPQAALAPKANISGPAARRVEAVTWDWRIYLHFLAEKYI